MLILRKKNMKSDMHRNKAYAELTQIIETWKKNKRNIIDTEFSYLIAGVRLWMIGRLSCTETN